MRKRLIKAALVVAIVLSVVTVAVPAQADPCDVHVKGVYIDIINCG